MQNKLELQMHSQIGGKTPDQQHKSKRVYIAVHMGTYTTGQVIYEASLQVQARSRHELTLE